MKDNEHPYRPAGVTFKSHEQYAEAGALASMYMRPSVAKAVISTERITRSHFEDMRNREIFDIFAAELDDGHELDALLILPKIIDAKWASPGYFNEVIESLFNPSGSNYPYYCQILREKYAGRLNFERGREWQEMASSGATPEELLAFSKETEKLMSEQLLKADAGNKDTEAAREEWHGRKESMEPRETFGFGIAPLDFHVKPERGDLVVVAGPTSGGKSVLLLMAAEAAMSAGKSALIVSLEMGAMFVLDRLMAHRFGVRMKANWQGPTQDEKDLRYSAYKWAGDLISDSKLIIVDRETTIESIESIISRSKCDVAIVDYVQLIDSATKYENRQQFISDSARGLKDLAGRTGKSIFTASQLNDQGLLRESRAIGQHADIILLINKDEDDKPEIHVTKNRNGAAGQSIPVTLRGDISRFEYRDTWKG